MGQVEKRLQELGIQLPELVSPKGSYVLFKQVGDLIFVSDRALSRVKRPSIPAVLARKSPWSRLGRPRVKRAS